MRLGYIVAFPHAVHRRLDPGQLKVGRDDKIEPGADSATPFVPQSVPGSEIGSDSLLVKGALVLSVQVV